MYWIALLLYAIRCAHGILGVHRSLVAPNAIVIHRKSLRLAFQTPISQHRRTYLYNTNQEQDEPLDSRYTIEELEKESIDYVDKGKADNQAANETTTDSNSYVDVNRIKAFESDPINQPIDGNDSSPTTVTNVKRDEEQPILSGHGMDMEFTIEDYELHSTCGRLNEWPKSWNPVDKVLSFFPIIVDEYSLHPSPLQIGFDEPVRFRGRHVESVFNSLIEDVTVERNGKDEQIQTFGICFLNPSSGQLAPLAVYAQLLNKEFNIEAGQETLTVTGRVLGRVLLSRILLEEPFIKAIVRPIEDKPGLVDPESVAKLVDEVSILHDECNKHESLMMKTLEQPYAVEKIKMRPPLHDHIDARLNNFGIDINKQQQAFAQLASYAAFEWHLTAAERYDCLTMQNSEDRLIYVRDNLKLKLRQLQLLKTAPKQQLEDMIERLRESHVDREKILHPTETPHVKDADNEQPQ